MINAELFKAITEFSECYKYLKWNNEDNVKAFKNLVDLSIKYRRIPECNRNEPSTWGRLIAAVTYVDNRIRFCED